MSRLWMICYDISDDRARRAVEQALVTYGERVQRSVFECFLNAEEIHWLRTELARMIDIETDNIRYYPLCAWCEARVSWQGQGKQPEDTALYLV